MTAFSNAGSFDTGSSNEMLRDAIYLSIDNLSTNRPYDLSSANWERGPRSRIDSIPPLHQFKVDWRQDADRIIVVFSDEEDQSFLIPTLPPNDLIAAITAAPDTKLYVFTQYYYRTQWRRYTDPTGGSAFNLTSNSEQMYNDLMSILDEICLPDDSNAQRALLGGTGFQRVKLGSRYDFEIGICY